MSGHPRPRGGPRLEVLTWPGSRPTRSAPVVLVHGAWHAAWCWDDGFGARLASNGPDVHALSLRGHGRSGGTLWRSRIQDYIADLGRVVDALHRPPVLVGHSMGGYVVQKYLRSGLAAAGAVLLAPMPHTGVAACMGRLSLIAPGAVAAMHATLGRRPVAADTTVARRLFFSAAMPEPTVRRHAVRLGGEAFLAYLDMLGLDPCRPRRGAVPTLVLGAGADAMFTRREVESVAVAHGAPVEFVPGMAHDMMLDPGWETVADRIGGWVAGLAPVVGESRASASSRGYPTPFAAAVPGVLS